MLNKLALAAMSSFHVERDTGLNFNKYLNEDIGYSVMHPIPIYCCPMSDTDKRVQRVDWPFN